MHLGSHTAFSGVARLFFLEFQALCLICFAHWVGCHDRLALVIWIRGRSIGIEPTALDRITVATIVADAATERAMILYHHHHTLSLPSQAV